MRLQANSHQNTSTKNKDRQLDMLKIEFMSPFQKELLVDVTHHDSNEEPEDLCVNKLVSFKVNGKVYHYFGQDIESAFNKFKSMLVGMSKLGPVDLPDTAFCVSTKFMADFSIDWAAIERHYNHRSAEEG